MLSGKSREPQKKPGKPRGKGDLLMMRLKPYLAGAHSHVHQVKVGLYIFLHAKTSPKIAPMLASTDLIRVNFIRVSSDFVHSFLVTV